MRDAERNWWRWRPKTAKMGARNRKSNKMISSYIQNLLNRGCVLEAFLGAPLCINKLIQTITDKSIWKVTGNKTTTAKTEPISLPQLIKKQFPNWYQKRSGKSGKFMFSRSVKTCKLIVRVIKIESFADWSPNGKGWTKSIETDVIFDAEFYDESMQHLCAKKSIQK